MITKAQYIEFLVSTPVNYTCTYLADHISGIRHDSISDFLATERITAESIWKHAQPHIDNTESSYLIEGTSRHVVIVNTHKIPYISGLHTIVAKSKTQELDNHYKRYCFQASYIKQQFAFYAVGTKVSGISKTSIAKIVLRFPPTLAEQTAIATVLSEIDAAIDALVAKLTKARQIKQGMMQDLLTGRVRLF